MLSLMKLKRLFSTINPGISWERISSILLFSIFRRETKERNINDVRKKRKKETCQINFTKFMALTNKQILLLSESLYSSP